MGYYNTKIVDFFVKKQKDLFSQVFSKNCTVFRCKYMGIFDANNFAFIPLGHISSSCVVRFDALSSKPLQSLKYYHLDRAKYL